VKKGAHGSAFFYFVRNYVHNKDKGPVSSGYFMGQFAWNNNA
jgi:hypothetical protein